MLVIKSNQLASWILCLFVLAVRAQSGCKHDNCYNALFPCDSPLALQEALNYCATVGHYGATNYPTSATAACGNTNKRAYMSACQCGVACPSFQPDTISSSTTALTLTTLTTSTIVPGGNARSSSSLPVSATLVTPTSSTQLYSVSSSSALNSAVSNTLSPASPVSQGTSSLTATASSSAGSDPSSQDSASGTQLTISNPGSALTLSLTDIVSTITVSTSTATISDGSSSISLIVFSALSSTHSDFPEGQPSSLLSTLTSNSSRSVTTSLSPSLSSSSAFWTNITHTSGVGLPTFVNASTASSTLVDPTSVSASSVTDLSSSGEPNGANSTVSVKSATGVSIPLPRPTSIDTTCTSTSKPTLSTPCSSSFHYFPNSTSHTSVASVTNVIISASTFAVSLRPSLNRTLSTRSTSTLTTSEAPSCTSTSSSKMIENGDFEQGLSPWSIDMVDVMSTSYSLASPGANGSCAAFHVHMRRNSQTDDLRANLRLVSPLISPPAETGVSWAVSFWVRFGSGRATNSYVNLFANGEVAHRVDAADEGATNWTRVEFPYTTVSSDRMLQLVFSFALGNAPSNEVWIDKVAMNVIAAGTVPVGQGFAIAPSKAINAS
ncbi:uncharacterized protein F4812DRAFT_454262 [Daldinia caldariorum]|uniref:uncharacterized protein n=1 Tax=Daldinia caldariorum TaxID=326644 RepID=UPI0020081ECB|nr:uncharacterized protein F4812DRAFT_454262 [Daldinia caldariorum]KAI1472449.1 hypothetical protein F4812DRAFT_454262 [Daldinia caldariorum]